MKTRQSSVPCLHDSSGKVVKHDYTPRQLEIAAAMCKALSDPSRLRLLLWLAQGDLCVSELVTLEADKLSSISARLKLLHNAHLVTRRRETKHVYYALADQHVRNLLDNVLHHASEATA